jgi:hypothetical protein
LIDQLGNIEDAYAKAMELGKTTAATVIRYDAGFKLSRLFRLLGKVARQRSRSTSPSRSPRNWRLAASIFCRVSTRRNVRWPPAQGLLRRLARHPSSLFKSLASAA